MDLNNFYNHIKMCHIVVTKIREDLLHFYLSIKKHSEFAEHLIPDYYHPYYSWNVQIYTSLGNSLLVEMNNYTCVKSSKVYQAF